MRNSTSMRLILTLSALCVFLTGCPDKKPKYPTCKGDKDCKTGEHCVNKKCVQCKTDSDCDDGKECEANACVDKAGFCSTDADCPDFQICKGNECVACQSDDECAGGKCSDGACLREGQCVKNEDCQDDEDCENGVCKRFSLDGGQSNAGCKLQIVFFDFDTSRVRDDMRAALETNVECMKKSEQPVYIVGHTDPRGTDEYNIALSDGRARAAADYLARFGIDPARFHVVPKGEADATGTDESSWPQDRRVEFQWK